MYDLCKSQFWFSPKSTSDTVFDSKDLYDAQLPAFIDNCKAFDCVHHPTLINKMCNLNIHGKLQKWLIEYLAHRSHCCIANEAKSSKSTAQFYGHHHNEKYAHIFRPKQQTCWARQPCHATEGSGTTHL